jgi:uncharacterized protein (DUF427 family)/catechol 2,3-dioxygenase-like lactoylglutathione lyase family enzyme
VERAADWEVPYYPAYYLPVADVRTELLVPTATVTHSPSRGDAHHFTVKVAGKEAKDAALRYVDSPIEELRELIRLDWNAMDGWFEEDEEVYTHPRDPYTRVDILATSRRVRVELDGVVLAESTHARVLFETALPPRWYLPKTDLRMDLLVPTGTATHCPYKGQAQYWSVRLGDCLVEDLAWSYRTTLPESQKIVGLVAFHNEEVDLFVDDRLQERPRTKFSRPSPQGREWAGRQRLGRHLASERRRGHMTMPMPAEWSFGATIPAKDLEGTRRFYEDVLGAQVVMEDPGGIIYRSGDSTFSLYPTEYAGTAQHTLGAFMVRDVETTVADLRSKGVRFEDYDLPGVKTVNGIADIDGFRGAWFKDPEGNILSVVQFAAT